MNSRPSNPRRTPATARDIAFVVLDEYQRTETFVGPLLERHAEPVSADDRRLASEMVFGVVRRQATLDALLGPHVRRPRHKIEGALWTLMRIGAYQLVFMGSVPPHAALNETVETARRLGSPRWTGFLNGVLRAVARTLTDRFADAPAANAVPLTGGSRPVEYRVEKGGPAPSRDEFPSRASEQTGASPLFSTGVYRLCEPAPFPDPQRDPLGYFAAAFSFPKWLVRRWGERFDLADLVRLGFWFNAPPSLALRVNLLRATRETYLDALHQAGIAARPGELPEAVWLEGSARIEQLPGFEAGWFSVQDETAMRAARLLSPRPGETVLDLCAAPGTKTTHLAELMQNQGTVVAADIQTERLAKVEENSRRLELDIIRPRLICADGSDIPDGPFDAVLLDVPCSNTGVLGKRPEARWRLRPKDVAELASLQRRLLNAVCERLRPGGRLVYSTCSIEPEENRQVVQSLRETCPEFQLAEEADFLPGRPADGGYQALLLK